MSDIAGYVFGYGSLLDPVSMASTLFGDHAARSGPEPAELIGYRRVWNVAVPSGPGHRRPMQHTDRTPYLHDVACLGIEAVPGARCHGAVYGLTELALELLDGREQRYDRVEVTQFLSVPSLGLTPGPVPPAPPPEPGQPRRIGLADLSHPAIPVWTYLPKPHVPVRFSQQLEAGRIVVTANYLRTVERGMRLLGDHALAGYLAEPIPQCPTVDLTPALARDWDGDWEDWAVEGSA